MGRSFRRFIDIGEDFNMNVDKRVVKILVQNSMWDGLLKEIEIVWGN